MGGVNHLLIRREKGVSVNVNVIIEGRGVKNLKKMDDVTCGWSFSQYFGEPINCDFKGIDSEMASDYCWIHGSSYIPPEYQQHMKCIVDLDGIESADDAPDTSYYQVIYIGDRVQTTWTNDVGGGLLK